MRLLIIHCDWMEYEPVEPIRGVAEEVERRRVRCEELLTVFTTVEGDDDPELAERAADEILSIGQKVSVNRVLIYPYAHLSTDLAEPNQALEVLMSIERLLTDRGFEVRRAPFGWYKSFELRAKGHPLAEWSRTIDGTERTREDVIAEVESRFVVLHPDGREMDLDLQNPDDCALLHDDATLLAYVKAEYGEARKQEPPSIREMRRLELVDYEPASDSGHFRLLPKGAFMFTLLKDWADGIARSLGCLEVDTPVIYDWSLPDIRGQAKTFHERHYVIMTPDKRKMVLRFAGDFGLFRMMKGATLSYRHLPVRMYEFSKSFRFEQRGELSGLKRLRGFHMPDIHSFSRDLEEGWSEYETIYKKYLEETERMGIDFAVVFRVVESFYLENRERLISLLNLSGRPALIEILSGMIHYWAVKNEFQALDAVGGNCQLATVQLDVEDASRYGITYIDANGQEKGCIILHCSIGSIERWMYILLESALKMKKPELPLWVAPTQVRLVPVSAQFILKCEEIASLIRGRVDIDDRDEKVSRKIRDAEREWINMIVVIGERELVSDRLPVRFRDGSVRDMTIKEINDHIENETEGWPQRDIPLPTRLSRRFSFR